MSCVIECVRSGEQGYVEVEGRLRGPATEELKLRLMNFVSTGCQEVTLGFSGVFDIDKDAIEVLLDAEAHLAQARGELAIVAPTPLVENELAEAGLDYLIRQTDSSQYFDLPLASARSSDVPGPQPGLPTRASRPPTRRRRKDL